MYPVPPPALRANQAKSGQIGPRYGGVPLLITPDRMRAAEVESGPKLTTVERNGTKRNRIKSFATPAHSYEAKQGHHQGRLAHRVRVGGVPNETTPAPFSVSRLGVNRAKQGQLGPVLPPRRSRAAAEKGGLINSEQLPERRAGRRRRVECVIIVAAYRRWAGGRRMCNGRISQMSGLR